MTSKKKARSKPPISKPIWLLCPQCKEKVYEVLPTVDGYTDPKFQCKKCGYKKPLFWRR